MLKKAILSFALLFAAGTALTSVKAAVATDSVRVYINKGDFSDLSRVKKANSLAPVNIKVQGRKLNVESPRMQMLPVYNFSGSLFGSFKLCKGVNLINGLPRGIYVINNRKYTIS